MENEASRNIETDKILVDLGKKIANSRRETKFSISESQLSETTTIRTEDEVDEGLNNATSKSYENTPVIRKNSMRTCFQKKASMPNNSSDVDKLTTSQVAHEQKVDDQEENVISNKFDGSKSEPKLTNRKYRRLQKPYGVVNVRSAQDYTETDIKESVERTNSLINQLDVNEQIDTKIMPIDSPTHVFATDSTNNSKKENIVKNFPSERDTMEIDVGVQFEMKEQDSIARENVKSMAFAYTNKNGSANEIVEQLAIEEGE